MSSTSPGKLLLNQNVIPHLLSHTKPQDDYPHKTITTRYRAVCQKSLESAKNCSQTGSNIKNTNGGPKISMEVEKKVEGRWSTDLPFFSYKFLENFMGNLEHRGYYVAHCNNHLVQSCQIPLFVHLVHLTRALVCNTNHLT